MLKTVVLLNIFVKRVIQVQTFDQYNSSLLKVLIYFKKSYWPQTFEHQFNFKAAVRNFFWLKMIRNQYLSKYT